MKIAVEGCAHGELEKIFESIQFLEEEDNIKVDLLICCGDFQSTRNKQDLRSMAVPVKYQKMCSFYKYYSGEKTAPILTLFIGGNHEASNYLQELSYGGWVAPNIYYMGYASVVNIAGVRIGGISGIYKGHDYMKGHFEKAPYTEETKRSVYHVRNLEVFRLKQVKEPVDIMISHDWPRGIYNYGNVGNLLEAKPFFMEDIQAEKLGSRPCEELMHELKPKFWFSAHLHVKFAAIVPHAKEGDEKKFTKFLALDKCLPKRKFLQILDVPSDASKPVELEYDLEWLTIVYLTNHLLSVKRGLVYMPGKSDHERWIFTPTDEERTHVLNRFEKDLKVPLNFTRTAEAFDLTEKNTPTRHGQARAQLNPQTTLFCSRLGVDDPMALLLDKSDNDSTSSRISLPSFLTPERSGNLSQFSSSMENSLLSQSSDSPSFISLDISSISPITPQPSKRSSLCMPPPKLSFDSEESVLLRNNESASSWPDRSNLDVSSISPDSPQSLNHSSLCMPPPKLWFDSEESVLLRNNESASSCPDRKMSESSSSKSSPVSLSAPKMADEDTIPRCLEKSKSLRSDEGEKSTEGVESNQSNTPVIKRFKRRNEALYTSTNEDQ